MDTFGIDLGTTNSCIAETTKEGNPVVIKNTEDLETTPSVVYFDEYDTAVVGGEAKRCMQQDSLRAVAFIKREMSNPNYQRTIGGKTIGGKEIPPIKITPVKISAMILKKLVDDANLNRQFRRLEPVKDVVITVPAYFGNNERELTKQAGEAAGLNVLALLNEPVAAALSYGEKDLEGKTFMIYDLGGGTLDVSILTMNQGDMITLSTDGDHHLGGYDWDSALADYALKEIGETVTYEDIKNTQDGGSLILAAEQCKKKLSRNDESQMRFRYKGRPRIVSVSRSQFEDLTADLLQRTFDIVQHALSMSTSKNPVIDDIILVGGSSYMPMVQKRMKEEFPDSTVRLDQFQPDLAVAKGAAIHAYNLSNGNARPASGVRIAKDLGSRSYGMGTCDYYTSEYIIQNLILRTDPMIYEGKAYFSTKDEGQTCVSIEIYENTSTEKDIKPSLGKLIGQQTISWGYPVPKGTQIVDRIKRGSDGIVHIEVECQNKVVRFEIRPDQALTPEELDDLRDELDDMQL